MLKTFTVAPEQDSVRTAFSKGPRLSDAPLSLERLDTSHPVYAIKQYGARVALIRGKEMVCGGEYFAVIPLLPLDWEEQGAYRHSLDNVPYWDGEQRLRSLDDLLYSLSQGWTLPEALADAVDAQDEDDAFFASTTSGRDYTGQPEDFPLPVPIEWEPEPEPLEPSGMSPDEYLASKQPPPAKIHPWTFWYRGEGGDEHVVILEATYEVAQRVWDKLSTTLDMTSKRP
jgi:hypothetical protein